MYMLFAGSDHYPGGGWNDWRMSSEQLQDLYDYLSQSNHIDWWHIVKDGSIVAEGPSFGNKAEPYKTSI